jgi:hypothetical protein
VQSVEIQNENFRVGCAVLAIPAKRGCSLSGEFIKFLLLGSCLRSEGKKHEAQDGSDTDFKKNRAVRGRREDHAKVSFT